MNNQIQLVLKSSTAEMSLNDHELGIYLTPELDGLVGLPEIRTTSGVNAGYDGGWTSAQNYDARSITIRGVIANTDVATVELLRKRLVSLAGQGKSEELTLDLVTEAGNAYTLQVRTIALEMAMQSVLEKQEFMLQLRADDPLIYDAGESAHEATLQVAKATGGFTIDFELPLAITGGSEESVVNNDGLEEVPTIVKMYGALHNPKIINQTNNEQMQIMTDLGYAEGAWHTPSEASEGTNISLTDTPDSAPFSDIQLKGNTEQNGTPTPSAPVAVQTVTGEQTVQICGKNLFGDTTEGGNISSTTGANIQGATLTRSVNYCSVMPNSTYTISNSLGVNIALRFYDSAGIFLSGENAAANPRTFTVPAGAYRVRFVFVSPNTDNDIQLELSSTATAYEPYQSQSYEINLGKNLFDKDNIDGRNGYLYNNNAVVKSTFADRIFILPCQPNTTYTISRSVKTTTFRAAYCNTDIPAQTSTEVQIAVAGQINNNNGDSITITTGISARYLVVHYGNANNDANINESLATIQVEKGSQATSYATYFTPIELCKIGDYQDYIYKSGGKWYLYKATHKIVLNGTENWGSGGVTNTQYTDSITNYAVSGNSPFSSRFAGVSNVTGAGAVPNDNTIAFINRNDVYRFYIKSSVASSVDAIKTWLSNNNLSVYYALATPTDTEITNEALIAQLENLLNLSRTYQGQTNLSSTYVSGNMPAILNVSYYTEKEPDTRDELIIDSRLHTVTLNGLDIYHLIGEGSEFLMLEPGENRLSLQSDITGDNGYAVVSYKQGYLSI